MAEEVKIYLVQKKETPPPSGVLQGYVTEQVNKSGKAKKFKKDREGDTYQIKWCSNASEPFGDFGNVTYYLTIERGESSPAEQTAPGNQPPSSDVVITESRVREIVREELAIMRVRPQASDIPADVSGVKTSQNASQSLTEDSRDLSELDF